MVSVIFNAVQISSFSSINSSAVLVFLCSVDEIEPSESDVLFLRLFNRSVIILAINLREFSDNLKIAVGHFKRPRVAIARSQSRNSYVTNFLQKEKGCTF